MPLMRPGFIDMCWRSSRHPVFLTADPGQQRVVVPRPQVGAAQRSAHARAHAARCQEPIRGACTRRRGARADGGALQPRGDCAHAGAALQAHRRAHPARARRGRAAVSPRTGQAAAMSHLEAGKVPSLGMRLWIPVKVPQEAIMLSTGWCIYATSACLDNCRPRPEAGDACLETSHVHILRTLTTLTNEQHCNVMRCDSVQRKPFGRDCPVEPLRYCMT